MAKSKQLLRVILSKNGQKKSLITTWREGFDFYSVISGNVGHRAYHASGVTHTKTEMWGKEHYNQRTKKTAAHHIDGPEILQVLIFKMSESLYEDDSIFKNFTKKEDANTRAISHPIAEGALIALISGFSPTEDSIKQQFNHNSSNLEDIFFEKNPAGPSSFIVTFKNTNIDENEFKTFLEKSLGIINLLIPPAGAYTSINGNSQEKSLHLNLKKTFPDLEIRKPKLVNSGPPHLPIRIYEWLQTQEIEIYINAYKNPYFEVGDISIKILPFLGNLFLSPSHGRQPILIIPTKILHNSRIFTNSYLKIVQRPPNSAYVTFEYGANGGHTERQISILGEDYHIELIHVSNRSVDKNGNYIQTKTAEMSWQTNYTLKIIKLDKNIDLTIKEIQKHRKNEEYEKAISLCDIAISKTSNEFFYREKSDIQIMAGNLREGLNTKQKILLLPNATSKDYFDACVLAFDLGDFELVISMSNTALNDFKAPDIKEHQHALILLKSYSLLKIEKDKDAIENASLLPDGYGFYMTSNELSTKEDLIKKINEKLTKN